MSPAIPAPSPGLKRQVVYAPACVTRMMGPAYGDDQQRSVHEVLLSLFNKAGYEVIYPKVRIKCLRLSPSLFPERYSHRYGKIGVSKLKIQLL